MKSAVCVLFLTGLKKVKRRKKANSAKKISVYQQIFNILVTWVGIQTKDSIWKMLTQNWNNFSPKLVSPSLLTYSLFVSFTKISSNEMNQFHGIFDGVFCFFWEIFLGKDYTVLIRYLSIFFQVYQKENYKTKTSEILFMILLTDTVVSKQLLKKLKIIIELWQRPLLQGKVL